MLIPYHDDNPTHRFPYVTVAIIVLNVLAAAPFGFFAFQLQGELPTHQMRVLWTRYGFVPQELTNLQNGQPVVVDLYRELGENPAPVQDRTLTIEPSLGGVAMTLITCMFLHGGLYHLLGNMLFFWIYGNNIEDRIGPVLFALFYLLGGIIATLCHWLMAAQPMANVPMIGASGAVAVVMGAYIVTYPTSKIRVLFLLGCIPLFFKVPAVLVLAFWFGEQLLSVFWEQQGFATSVALWAHIGGFVVGAALMPLLAAGTPEPTEDWDKETKEQFDFEHVDPNRRFAGGQYDRGIKWTDFDKTTPSRKDQKPQDPGISWEDDRPQG